MKRSKMFAVAVGLLTSTQLLAETAQEERIKQQIETRMRANIKIDSVTHTPYAGMYEVRINGDTFYTDDTARFLFAGKVLDLTPPQNSIPARIDLASTIKPAELPKIPLSLLSFIISFSSFCISSWVAYKIGRIDFERRRQDFLMSCTSFQAECNAKIYELESLCNRLDRLPLYAINNPETPIGDWSNCRERLTLRKNGLADVVRLDQAAESSIEKLPRGLRNRVDLERIIGGEERSHRSISERAWNQFIVEMTAEVAAIEDRVVLCSFS